MEETMPSTLKISPPDVELTISRGGTDKTTLTVTKASGAFVGYAGEPEPAKYRGWVSMKPDSLALLPPDIPSKDVELRITVPQDAPYGPHDFKIQFVAEKPLVAEEDPMDTSGVDIHVDVPMPWLERYWWVVVILIVAIVAIVAFVPWDKLK
jgi:hypothetical protein